MKNINPEIIWEKEKWFDFTNVVKPEIIEIPDYSYWQSQNTLDYNISLRNKPNPYAWVWIRTSEQWVWTQIITGVGFKPKMITIQACWWSNYSHWHATSITNQAVMSWPVNSWMIIIVTDWTLSLYSIAQISAISNDWFTINWIQVDITTDFTFQCFW